MPTTVFISTSSFGTTGRRPLELLEEAGIEVRMNPHGRKLQPGETAALLPGADGLIAGTEVLDRGVLEKACDLRVISRCGFGTDNVDLEAAKELGIEVRFVRDAHVDAVAELTLAGVLALLRHIGKADRDLRAGIWRKPMGSLLRGSTVGIVGLGRVGRRLVDLLGPFSCTLLAHDPVEDPGLANRVDIEYLPLPELLSRCEIVCLLATQSPDGELLMSRQRIASMRPGALLVNTARGGLVDEKALADALGSGRLAGAYLDVFEAEPYEGPLVRVDNALLTPHMGSYARESRLRMETEAVENLLDSLREVGR